MGVDRVPPEDFISSTIGESAVMNTYPRGRIGRDTLSADSAGTTSLLTICSVQVTARADRTLSIHASLTVRSDIAGGVKACIFESGIQIQRRNTDALGADQDLSWDLIIETQPSAGLHTYELAIGPSGVDGNTVYARASGGASGGVCVLYVDDVGPAYA